MIDLIKLVSKEKILTMKIQIVQLMKVLNLVTTLVKYLFKIYLIKIMFLLILKIKSQIPLIHLKRE